MRYDFIASFISSQFYVRPLTRTLYVLQELLDSKPRMKCGKGMREVSATTHCLSQPTDDVHAVDGHCHGDAGREQTSKEEAGGVQETASGEVAIDHSEMQDLGSVDQNSNTESNVQIGRDGVNQNDTQSGIRESLGAACASSSLQSDFDFEGLEQEEKIAQMMAKLRQSEAAVNRLSSS